GTPVSKATIRIEGTKIVSVSDDQGLYKLEQVPYGKQTILVTSVEIKSKKLPLEVNKPIYDLHIHIDPRGDISLDEVR
ncbi:UNVERIFIED_CONTAM: carboxypeptidase-like regulatory domain-containing protein, partial [Salmonella enterica subsp. enterica serovar Weltevreden]